MTYPLISRTYFASESQAWAFVKAMAGLTHWVVSDYGVDASNEAEPYWVETYNDPFATKNELMRAAGLMA